MSLTSMGHSDATLLSITQGLHPRTLADGFELAKNHTLEFLDKFKVCPSLETPVVPPLSSPASLSCVSDPKAHQTPHNQVAAPKPDRELLLSVARTSLRTKLAPDMAERLTEIVTDAVLTIQRPGQPIDLHMVERMHVSAEVSKAEAQYRRC